MSSVVPSISFIELIIALTVAFLLSNVALVLVMGGSPFLQRGMNEAREAFTDMFQGVPGVPQYGCGMGRPAFGNARGSCWGPNADVDSPYGTPSRAVFPPNTGTYITDVTEPHPITYNKYGSLRSPRPLAIQGDCRQRAPRKPNCRPVQGNPPTTREVEPLHRQQPRQCRSLPYSMDSDLPGEHELFPSPVDSSDTLGFGAGLDYCKEGFSNPGKAEPKEPQPLQALSGSSGAKYNFVINNS